MDDRLRIVNFVTALVLIAFTGCVSQRETCEWHETPEEWEGLCILMSYSMMKCPKKIAQGTATVEQCNQTTDRAMLTCAKYLYARSKCSKESDLPFYPKIVKNQEGYPTESGFQRVHRHQLRPIVPYQRQWFLRKCTGIS